MQIKKLPIEFVTARPILQTIEKAGYEAYFVGGSVRDTILQDNIHDVDIATSAYPSEIKALFPKTIDTGIKHGTVMILSGQNKYEVTTFRTESGYQDFRRPDKVTFVRSLAEDLKRRDFTVNALALKEDGTVVDLFNGLQDLKDHILRAVGKPEERFHEDALRMMRAIRFASKLDFTIEAATEAAIKHHAELLEKIAVERILVEFNKMMMGQKPVKGIRYFLETGLYAFCPQLNEQLPKLKRLLKIREDTHLKNENQVWLLMCRVLTISSNQSHHFLKAWKTSNELISAVSNGLDLFEAMDQNAVSEQILFQTGKTVIKDVLTVANVLPNAGNSDQLLDRYEALPIKNSHELKINGGILLKAHITTPGPQLGKLLAILLNKVLTGKIENKQPDLLLEAKKIVSED
ncbi:CCA tRNA nucleotidyltransferase [Pediococcus ethanolidurans]|uniref:CCA-adding enzyme n=1 Tax=Pediococcus ethanolidurans TaxID=319653 RepID=A0A0R2JZ12_9LACO|nr:CCA tRNA nucleotidyltransferase [Pediococcus ethanolidurans]KRN82528.1 tRNA adenylyltransferase [Pediococcus ethanolidurans]GEN94958.1 CCA-adding enzyme [Pediococcus ethanolidurans]SER49877.1 tRNA nucleotidyltransferase (CCA-adding enzyme) [Pediococcus ethanolidurans]